MARERARGHKSAFGNERTRVFSIESLHWQKDTVRKVEAVRLELESQGPRKRVEEMSEEASGTDEETGAWELLLCNVDGRAQARSRTRVPACSSIKPTSCVCRLFFPRYQCVNFLCRSPPPTPPRLPIHAGRILGENRYFIPCLLQYASLVLKGRKIYPEAERA